MARIRSTLPGQWNDDDFLECTPLARLLGLALRNFADDNGVFEWKPKQIKRSCLPADACDVVPLLRELEDNKQVRKFTFDGREYGAIRKFRVWQRPKTPKSIYPCPPEIRKYVGLERGAISEIDDDDGGEISENTTASSGDDFHEVRKTHEQREEVGGRREEVGGKKSSEAKASDAGASATPSALEGKPPEPDPPVSEPIDDKTWLFRDGLAWLSETTGAPLGKFRSLMGKWLSTANGNAAVLRAVIEEAKREQIVDPAAWITKVLPIRVKEAASDATGFWDTDAEWENLVICYAKHHVWPPDKGPKPGEPYCQVPAEILKRHHYEIPDHLLRRQPQQAGVH